MIVNRENNMDIKRTNKINIMRTIFTSESISQKELADTLNISWPTVLQNVKKLQEEGLVEEIGEFQSTGGRKARAFAPVLDAYVAIGLSITNSHVGIVLVDLSGNLVKYIRKTKSFEMNETYFKTLGELVEDIIKTTNYSKDKILGVGMALPGIIDECGETLKYSHVLGIQDIMKKVFCRYIPYPCTIINDANAAGHAELWTEMQPRNIVYLSLSSSVGGAILLGNTIYMGDNFRGGEFGHNTLVPNGKPCYCGKLGCVDAYCSAKVLAEHTDGNLALFFDKLMSGDSVIQEVWDKYLDWLAIIVNNLRMTFDCDVIIGGYVGGFFELFEDDLRERLKLRNTFGADASYLIGCRYKLEASAMGAALEHIEMFIKNL